MYYGHSYNRYDRIVFNEAEGTLVFSKVYIKPSEEVVEQLLMGFDLGTKLLWVFEWPKNQLMKITIGNILMALHVVFEVEHIEGPEGFLKLWQPRLDKAKQMRVVQRRYAGEDMLLWGLFCHDEDLMIQSMADMQRRHMDG